MNTFVKDSLFGEETETVHKFERRGLGAYPYAYVGMDEKVLVIGTGLTAVTKPGGTCDYCGTGIIYCFMLKPSCGGKPFVVGSDCIMKSGDAGMMKAISGDMDKLKKEKAKRAKETKAKRVARRIEAAKERLKTVVDVLSEKPHPTEWFAKEGKTLLDYVRWCFENGQGERAATIIEKA